MEAAEEKARGGGAIGTTLRGIGPTYSDRYAREGLPIGLLASFDRLRGTLSRPSPRARTSILTKLYGAEPLDVGEIAREHMRAAADALCARTSRTPRTSSRTLSHRAGTSSSRARRERCSDIAFGTYPFVTSSYTTAAGVSPGTGVPPSMDRRGRRDSEGVRRRASARDRSRRSRTTKAGARSSANRGARVRGHDRTPAAMRLAGHGGAPILGGGQRRSTDSSSRSSTCSTRSDAFPSVSGYTHRRRERRHVPADVEELRRAEPVYEELPGWEDEHERRAQDQRTELPEKALAYLRRIEELSGATRRGRLRRRGRGRGRRVRAAVVAVQRA